jgi:hypothetical protein
LMINTHSGDDSPLYMVKSFWGHWNLPRGIHDAWVYPSPIEIWKITCEKMVGSYEFDESGK